MLDLLLAKNMINHQFTNRKSNISKKMFVYKNKNGFRMLCLFLFMHTHIKQQSNKKRLSVSEQGGHGRGWREKNKEKSEGILYQLKNLKRKCLLYKAYSFHFLSNYYTKFSRLSNVLITRLFVCIKKLIARTIDSFYNLENNVHCIY